MKAEIAKYFVMERSETAVAGAITIATRGCKADALAMCKRRDDRWVLSQTEHDAWHAANIAPYYQP